MKSYNHKYTLELDSILGGTGVLLGPHLLNGSNTHLHPTIFSIPFSIIPSSDIPDDDVITASSPTLQDTYMLRSIIGIYCLYLGAPENSNSKGV